MDGKFSFHQSSWTGAEETVQDQLVEQDQEFTPSKIVVHHSVTDSEESRENAHKNRSDGTSLSDMGSYIYYHVAVFKDGSYKQYRRLGERPRATRNNNDGFHIVLQGNFDQEEPTEAQLQTLRTVIKDVRSEYGLLPVFEHGELEGEATSCAGKHFDTSMISKSTDLNPTNYGVETAPILERAPKKEDKKKEKDDETGPANNLGTFHLSRYYRPIPGQQKYAKGSYQADLQMNCG
jgi:hypothetical protein